jgi:hypothetical protein
MDAQIAKQAKRVKKAKEKWLRSLGITSELGAELGKSEWFKIPSGEVLLREEEFDRAYRRLQKGRPTREFLARLEEAFYSKDYFEAAAAIRIRDEIFVQLTRKRGRPRLPMDRREIREEARRRMAAGEKKNEVVRSIADRVGAKESYIRRTLEDRQ